MTPSDCTDLRCGSEVEGMSVLAPDNLGYSVVQNHLLSYDHIKSVIKQLIVAINTTRYSKAAKIKKLNVIVL